MSGILDEKNRDPLERYYTPMSVVEHHLATTTAYRPGAMFVDPFAGDGRYQYFAALAHEGDPRIAVGGDIDPFGPPWTPTRPWRDTLKEAVAFGPERIFLATNPAFTQAAELVRWCAGIAATDGIPVTATLLVPVSFLEATEGTSRHDGRSDIFGYSEVLWGVFDVPSQALAPVHINFAGRIRFEGPAIEARQRKGLKVGGANMQYAYVDFEFPRPQHPCTISWHKAPPTKTPPLPDAEEGPEETP